MKQPNITGSDRPQTIEEQSFFDTQAVQTAHPVVPLAEIQNEKPRYIRIPRQAKNENFNPLMLVVILLPLLVAFTALGTFFYNSQAQNNSNSADEINEAIIPAEQIDVKPIKVKSEEPTVSKNATVSSYSESQNNETVEDEADNYAVEEQEERIEKEEESVVAAPEPIFDKSKPVEDFRQSIEQEPEIVPEIKRKNKKDKKPEKNNSDKDKVSELRKLLLEDESGN